MYFRYYVYYRLLIFNVALSKKSNNNTFFWRPRTISQISSRFRDVKQLETINAKHLLFIGQVLLTIQSNLAHSQKRTILIEFVQTV